MFKISWATASDPHKRTFILVPNPQALFDAYWAVSGYGREDGCKPVDIKASNLDGDPVDMKEGMAAAAWKGT